MTSRGAIDETDVAEVGREYSLLEQLGSGSYGTVYRAENAATGAAVAVKKLKLDGFAEGIPATAIREITLLQDLSSPFVVRLLDVVCSDKGRMYLIFELLAEDLHSLITRNARAQRLLPVDTVRRYLRQMLMGLWYCHNNRVVHRDLKPGNVLVTADGSQVKIADFGLARAFELPLCTYTNEVVTLWYRAPEILLGERRYTPAVDVWSVGCILLEMATGRAVFRGENELAQLQKTFQVVGTPDEKSWPGLATLPRWDAAGQAHAQATGAGAGGFPRWAAQDLQKVAPGLGAEGAELAGMMLRTCPKKRCTVAEALDHPWLAGVDI